MLSSSSSSASSSSGSRARAATCSCKNRHRIRQRRLEVPDNSTAAGGGRIAAVEHARSSSQARRTAKTSTGCPLPAVHLRTAASMAALPKVSRWLRHNNMHTCCLDCRCKDGRKLLRRAALPAARVAQNVIYNKFRSLRLTSLTEGGQQKRNQSQHTRYAAHGRQLQRPMAC